MVKFALGIFVNDFLIANCSQTDWIPVNHPYSSIYPSFLIKIDKSIYYGFRQIWVHGEFGPIPIARSTQLPQLFQNLVTMFFLPFPSIFQEFFPCDGFFAYAHILELSNDLAFGCNGSMIRSRHPACILSIHPCLSNQDIIEGIV